eukprot:PhM_4_TR11660/c0_g1_i1/m.74736
MAFEQFMRDDFENVFRTEDVSGSAYSSSMGSNSFLSAFTMRAGTRSSATRASTSSSVSTSISTPSTTLVSSQRYLGSSTRSNFFTTGNSPKPNETLRCVPSVVSSTDSCTFGVRTFAAFRAMRDTTRVRMSSSRSTSMSSSSSSPTSTSPERYVSSTSGPSWSCRSFRVHTSASSTTTLTRCPVSLMVTRNVAPKCESTESYALTGGLLTMDSAGCVPLVGPPPDGSSRGVSTSTPSSSSLSLSLTLRTYSSGTTGSRCFGVLGVRGRDSGAAVVLLLSPLYLMGDAFVVLVGSSLSARGVRTASVVNVLRSSDSSKKGTAAVELNVAGRESRDEWADSDLNCCWTPVC